MTANQPPVIPLTRPLCYNTPMLWTCTNCGHTDEQPTQRHCTICQTGVMTTVITAEIRTGKTHVMRVNITVMLGEDGKLKAYTDGNIAESVFDAVQDGKIEG